MARYDLTDFEWSVTEPLLPNKPRGILRIDDRRVLNGISWECARALSGLTCRSATGREPSAPTASAAGPRPAYGDRIMAALTEAHNGDIQMIDGTSERVHFSAATLKKATWIVVRGEAGAVLQQNPYSHQPLRTTDKAGHHAGPDP